MRHAWSGAPRPTGRGDEGARGPSLPRAARSARGEARRRSSLALAERFVCGTRPARCARCKCRAASHDLRGAATRGGRGRGTGRGCRSGEEEENHRRSLDDRLTTGGLLPPSPGAPRRGTASGGRGTARAWRGGVRKVGRGAPTRRSTGSSTQRQGGWSQDLGIFGNGRRLSPGEPRGGVSLRRRAPAGVVPCCSCALSGLTTRHDRDTTRPRARRASRGRDRKAGRAGPRPIYASRGSVLRFRGPLDAAGVEMNPRDAPYQRARATEGRINFFFLHPCTAAAVWPQLRGRSRVPRRVPGPAPPRPRARAPRGPRGTHHTRGQRSRVP